MSFSHVEPRTTSNPATPATGPIVPSPAMYYSGKWVYLLILVIAVLFFGGAAAAASVGGTGGAVLAIVLVIIGLLVLIGFLSHVGYSIQPYENALVTVLGSYRGFLNPGFNVVSPVARVIRVDLRTQVLEVPRQEVITKDNSPTNVDAIIYIKVVDSYSAVFRVQDYRLATVALAQTTLRSVIGDMELDEILYNRERINARLRDILDEATDKWGVRVEAVEIKEVDPVGPVKAAMEEQTAAERQRRAAVLRADGEKRSAILVAEGQKRARILQAEGLRQSRILEAEGARMATILEAQGEAQRLRILAMGAAPLDAKALTVLSLDTASEMANGQATKILFPFEFSRLMEGASDYLSAGRTVPERALSNLDDLEKRLGSMDDILGPIPKQSELTTEIQSIEDEIKAESEESQKMLIGNRDAGVPSGNAPGAPSPVKAGGNPPAVPPRPVLKDKEPSA
jgi:regulator of protease activity HflC (stomatin/prohibitin superfamily)